MKLTSSQTQAEYRFFFRYPTPKTSKHHRKVEAFLQHKVGLNWVDIDKGQSLTHPNDRFDKEVGRKLALTRAIAHMPKALRRDIWLTYFNRGRTI